MITTNGFMVAVAASICSGIVIAAVGVLLTRISKKIDRNQISQEEAAKAQHDLQVLILKSTDALHHTTKELADCVEGKKEANGDLMADVKYQNEVFNEVDDFLRENGIR